MAIFRGREDEANKAKATDNERNRALDRDDTCTAYPDVVRGEYIYFIVFNILPP